MVPVQILAAAIVVLASASCAQAKEAEALDAANPFLNDVRADVTLEEFIARALRPFDQMSPEGEPILRQYLENQHIAETAQRRARNLSNTLRYDLDGDFNVTNAEVLLTMQTEGARRVRALTSGGPDRVREAADQFFTTRDTNRNGVIELIEAAAEPGGSERGVRLTPMDKIAASPLGQDGQITRAEVKKFAERTFAAVDKNRDGRVSRDEYISVREIKQR